MLILILLLLIWSQNIVAKSNLDFGTVKTKQKKVQRKVRLNLTIESSKVSTLQLELKAGDSDLEKLSKQNLKVKLKDKIKPLTKEGLKIDLQNCQQSTANKVVLPLIITIAPNEQPGIYQSQLIIRKISKNNSRLSTIKKLIKVEVEPWLIMKKINSKEKIKLNRINNKELSSFNYPYLKIVSNVPWRLYGSIKQDLLKQSRLLINISSNAKHYKSVNKEDVYLRPKPQLLAKGRPSKEGIQFYFELKISDFSKMKAGIMELPLQFYLVSAYKNK
ncbi:MAG: hypothetical protein ACQEP9_09285 [Bacillota bacterium]